MLVLICPLHNAKVFERIYYEFNHTCFVVLRRHVVCISSTHHFNECFSFKCIDSCSDFVHVVERSLYDQGTTDVFTLTKNFNPVFSSDEKAFYFGEGRIHKLTLLVQSCLKCAICETSSTKIIVASTEGDSVLFDSADFKTNDNASFVDKVDLTNILELIIQDSVRHLNHWL